MRDSHADNSRPGSRIRNNGIYRPLEGFWYKVLRCGKEGAGIVWPLAHAVSRQELSTA